MAMAITGTNKKKKKKTAFDAFFEAADDPSTTADQAVAAFNRQKAVAATPGAQGAMDAFTAGIPGGTGFEDFFRAADDRVLTTSDAVDEVLVGDIKKDEPPLPPVAAGGDGAGGLTVTDAPVGGTPTVVPNNDALRDEVLGAIRAAPGNFRGQGLVDYRTSGGQSLNELPGDVQDAINTYLTSPEYYSVLGENRAADAGYQLEHSKRERERLSQQLADEQRQRQEQQDQAAREREQRQGAAKVALEAQQAPVAVQASTAPIAPAAPTAADITNAATFNEAIPLSAETVTAPIANLNTGLNTEILSRLADLSGQRLQSDNELRRNQQALLADITSQAEAAGVGAVEGLTLPDVTAVSVPPRVESAMEQAIDQRLTDRLTGGQFLDPQSALTNEAEAQALERLQRESFLGGSTGLDAAEAAAMERMRGGATIPLDSELTTSAESVLLNRLLGGDNPALAAQRGRVQERYGTSMEEGRELLNRLGVLRGGDTADIFNELTRGRDQQLLDVDAMGFDLQSQALADALGYQGRRDALGLANQDLARGAIGDVAGLAGQRDQRALMEESLRREAIADTLPFQQRRDTLGLAEQDLQRAAIGDALSRQGMIDQRDLAESQLTGSMRGAATLPARMAQAGLQFDAANLQQTVADRTLARLLTQTEPTQREMFEEGIRQTREGERLATRADTRAEELLQAEMFGEVAGRGSQLPRQTLGGRGFEQDILNQELQRTLARTADRRAGQALEGEMFGEVTTGSPMDPRVRRTLAGQQFETAEDRAERALRESELSSRLQRGLAEADVTGIYDRAPTRQAQQDAFTREMARLAEGRAERGLTEDLLGSRLQRGLAEADVTGIFDRQETQQAQAARLDRAMRERELREGELSSRLQRELAKADVTGIYDRQETRQAAQDRRASEQDAFNQALAAAGLTGEYEGVETLAGRALESDLLTAREQRDLARADITGVMGYDDQGRPIQTRQAQMDAFNQALAAAGLTGQYEGAETLAGRADERAGQALASDLLTAREQRDLARADVTGVMGYDDQGRPIQTRQAQMDAFNQALAEAGLTGQYGEAETLAGLQSAEALRASRLQRGLAEAGVTGIYGREETQQARDARIRRDLAERGMTQDELTARLQRDLAEADVTGVMGYDDQGRPIQTRQAEMDAFNQTLAEAGLTGRYDGAETLAGRQSAEALQASRLQRALAEADVTGVYDRRETRQAEQDAFNRALAAAGLTGDFRGDDTLAQRQLDDALLSTRQQRDLAEADVTGVYGYDDQGRPISTRQAEMDAFNQSVARAGLTGQFEDAPTMSREAFEQDQTNQLISQILAAADPTQEGRLDPFAGALAEQAGLDTSTVQALSDALGISEMPSAPLNMSAEDTTAWNRSVERINDNKRSSNQKQAEWRALRALQARYGGGRSDAPTQGYFDYIGSILDNIT